MTDAAARARAFENYPLNRAIGLRLEEARPGFARISVARSPVTMGGVGGSVHGGVLALMVDVVMLEALFTGFDRKDIQPAGTADLNITYLRPALGERVFAEATVIKLGRQLAVTEVSILDEKGQLCARARTLYALRPAAATETPQDAVN